MSAWIVRAQFEGSLAWTLGPYQTRGAAIRAAGVVADEGVAVPGEGGSLVVLPAARVVRVTVEESVGDVERGAALVDEAAVAADVEAEAARPGWFARLFGRAA